MSIHYKWTLLVILLSFGLTGCGNNKVPVSKKLKEQYRLSNHEMSKLQYYISDDLVLKRVEDISKPRQITGGRLITEDVKVEDKIIIEENTPGVAVYIQPEGDHLNVSFEEGYTIPFRATGHKGYYRFVNHDSKNHRTQLRFFDVPYRAEGHAENIHLMIREDALKDIIEKEKVLSGREIDD